MSQKRIHVIYPKKNYLKGFIFNMYPNYNGIYFMEYFCMIKDVYRVLTIMVYAYPRAYL